MMKITHSILAIISVAISCHSVAGADIGALKKTVEKKDGRVITRYFRGGIKILDRAVALDENGGFRLIVENVYHEGKRIAVFTRDGSFDDVLLNGSPGVSLGIQRNKGGALQSVTIFDKEDIGLIEAFRFSNGFLTPMPSKELTEFFDKERRLKEKGKAFMEELARDKAKEE